jgi:drug/metabolite transporter (DMT)-like permease
MNYIWYAWATTILYGLGGIIAKISSKYHIDNPWLYNFIWMVMSLLFILPFAVYAGFGWPGDWVSILVLSLTNATSGILYVLCLYRMDVSVLAPSYSLRTPFVVLLGVILFHEALGITQVILIALIFIASIFVSLDEGMKFKSFLNRNMGLILITMINSAFYNVSIKYASMHNGFWEVVFWSNFLGLIFILPTLPLFIKDLKIIRLNKLTGIASSTVFGTLGSLASLRALGNNVSISIAIISLPLSMIFAIALSVFFPKFLEKHTAKVYAIRLIAAAVMVGAAVGLSR